MKQFNPTPSLPNRQPEAVVAAALSLVPGFDQWAHEPAPAQLTSQALSLDQQALMTLAAACLLRIAEEQLPLRRRRAA